MQWIQRNLFYVVWGGIAAVLTLLAFTFWYNGYQRNSELDDQLEQEKQQLDTLLQASPQPTPENAKIIQDDTARIERGAAEARKLFRPSTTSRLEAASFRKLLDDSIHQLNGAATAAHVLVPTNYNYTFSAQRVAVTFSPGSLNRLAARLDDVKALCQVLFDARVYTLDSIRRAAAADDEPLTSPELLVAKPTTNVVTGMVRHPYEVTFTGFTRELGRVLDALNRSPDFFIVRNLAVAAGPPPPAATPYGGQPPGGGFRLPAPVPQVRPPPSDPDNPDPEPDTSGDDPDMATPAAPRAPSPFTFRAATSDTVLDEQLLQFTLNIDLIRSPAGARP